MPARQIPGALIRAAVPSSAEGTDADLLGRFVTARDSNAFAELVRRHGPMVLGVCRRALGDTPDAEDAFQVVWLVLVRKARSLGPGSRVGNWLYGVATRTAAHTRATITRRMKQQELPDVPDPHPRAPDSAEIAAAVDAELAKLPDKYRAAVVLCELEGRTLKEAAEELGVPQGTLASRLARGRALLAERLRARGFAAAAPAGLLATATAPVSARLTDLVTALPKAGPQDVTPAVSELTRGVLSAMLANKLKVVGRWAVAVALAAGAVWASAVSARPEPPDERDGKPPYGRLDPRPPLLNLEDAAWDKLWRDEPYASRGVLEFASFPNKETVAFFKTKLKPLKTDKETVARWIAALDSDKQDEWLPAYLALDYFDPALVMTPREAWGEAKGHRARHRLAALLTGRPEVMNVPDPVRRDENDMQLVERDRSYWVVIYSIPIPRDRPNATGFQPQPAPKESREFPVAPRPENVQRPTWTQLTRAVVILEHIGTPEALALLKEMASGHPDALPTRTAKEAVERLTAPAP
jgi:RNA polymerase sigma factor (sigma-70 family)